MTRIFSGTSALVDSVKRSERTSFSIFPLSSRTFFRDCVLARRALIKRRGMTQQVTTKSTCGR